MTCINVLCDVDHRLEYLRWSTYVYSLFVLVKRNLTADGRQGRLGTVRDLYSEPRDRAPGRGPLLPGTRGERGQTGRSPDRITPASDAWVRLHALAARGIGDRAHTGPGSVNLRRRVTGHRRDGPAGKSGETLRQTGESHGLAPRESGREQPAQEQRISRATPRLPNLRSHREFSRPARHGGRSTSRSLLRTGGVREENRVTARSPT